MKQWKHKCELKLLVCEPNPFRPDRVTVGFILHDTDPAAPRVEVRIAKNLQAVKCIYPDADIEAIEGTLAELKPFLENVTDIENHLQNLPGEFPFDLSLLSKGAVLTNSMDAEVAQFENLYLKTIASNGRADVEIEYGRAFLLRKMQAALRSYGVLDFLRTDIPVEKYTFKGDPLKIDFGYSDESRNTYRMLHATSVASGFDKAKILALSWDRIREGVRKSLQHDCEMLAIIEDERFQQSQQAKDARGWLETAGIRVEPVAAMMTLAAEAKEALRV